MGRTALTEGKAAAGKIRLSVQIIRIQFLLRIRHHHAGVEGHCQAKCK